MERLFFIIGRINSVLLLLVLLGAAAAIASLMLETHPWQRRGAVAAPETATGKAPILLRFDRIETITGADTQMMRLTTDEKSVKYSSGHGIELRNVLFLTGTEKTARWLFKEHKNLILAAVQLGEDSEQQKPQPTRALYFEYVLADTNHDGSLSSDDLSNVGLTKPDGTGFVEVLHNVNSVLSHDMLDPQHLSVVYQKGQAVRHARYSLTDLKLEVDQEIINVPGTL